MSRRLGARALLSLLWHGPKAIDVVEAALGLGVFRALDEGWTTLDALAARTGTIPHRLEKLLECLESLGLLDRESGATTGARRWRSIEPLEPAARAVVGPESIERDRDRHAWQAIHGRLPAVLRGEAGVPPGAFAWPPSSAEQTARFEQSMAAGIPPIAASFRAARPWPETAGDRPIRVLDVGGGDGALARVLAEEDPRLAIDVYNLETVQPLARARFHGSSAASRLGFVAGDFFAEALPRGYDVLAFVRVLHDWREAQARQLLEKARDALRPGGMVVICEELRSPDRLAIQFFWSYFLIGVDACESRLRELEWYLATLEQLGFEDTRVHEGPFEIITARLRPTAAPR